MLSPGMELEHAAAIGAGDGGGGGGGELTPGTVAVAVAELLAGLGSMIGAVTVAVEVIVPLPGARATTRTVTSPSRSSVPKAQFTDRPVVLQDP